MRCTQWPTSALGSGMPSDTSPRLIGCQVVPPSSVRNAPAEEMATKMRSALRRIEQDRVQAHPAGAGLPGRRRSVGPEPRQLVPCLAAVGGAEERGVLHSRVDRVGIARRRLEMPDARELPRMWRPVVPEMRARDAVVHELIAHRLPRPPAVARALDQLSEPAGALRGIDAIRIGRRSLEMVDLPPSEVRTRDAPPIPLAVRFQDERPLARADQYPNPAHPAISSRGLRHYCRRTGRRRFDIPPRRQTFNRQVD